MLLVELLLVRRRLLTSSASADGGDSISMGCARENPMTGVNPGSGSSSEVKSIRDDIGMLDSILSDWNGRWVEGHRNMDT